MRKLITERVVRGAKPAENGAGIEIRDTAIPGFALRVLPSGTRTWSLVYHLRGKRRRMDLGRWPFLDAASARDAAGRAVGIVQAGRDPQEAGKAEKALTVAKLAGLYVELYAKRHKRSWRQDENMLALHVVSAWGDREAAGITRSDVRTLLESIAKTRPVQANRVLALVSKLFAWAVESEHVPANPAYRMPKPGEETARTRVLTDAEVAAVWRAAEADASPQARIFLLMLLTGQRGGEVRRLAYADLDGRWWTIPAKITKNKRPQRVYLSDPAAAIVEGLRRREKQEHAFSTRHFRRGERASAPPGRAFERVSARAALARPWTAHDLRRTVATKLAQLGTSRQILDRVLNHADTSVTAVYDLFNQEPAIREAMDKLAAEWARVLAL